MIGQAASAEGRRVECCQCQVVLTLLGMKEGEESPGSFAAFGYIVCSIRHSKFTRRRSDSYAANLLPILQLCGNFRTALLAQCLHPRFKGVEGVRTSMSDRQASSTVLGLVRKQAPEHFCRYISVSLSVGLSLLGMAKRVDFWVCVGF